MNTVTIAGYNINADHVKELSSLEVLKADERFFHQHVGEEREALCQQLWDAVCMPFEEVKQGVEKHGNKKKSADKTVEND